MKKAAVGFIFVTLLLDVIGLGIIIPVMPQLIIELTGVSLPEAAAKGGDLMIVYAIFQFIFAPVIGGLSDRFGRRPVLLLSVLGFGLDYLLLAFAPTYSWLFIGRIMAGIFGASFTTCSAYIADVSTPETKAQNFGLIGVAFGIGFILGPFLGGILGDFGTRIPFYAAAGVSFINVLYGLIVLPESLSRENRRDFSLRRANPLGTLNEVLKRPKLRATLGALFFVYVASHAVQATWNYYTEDQFGWDIKMVGYSLGFVGVMSALVQGLLIRIAIPKLGQFKAIVYGFLFYILGLILFAFANQGWMLFAILVLYSLGGIAGPAIQGFMSNLVDKNEQGELQGGISATMSLSLIAGPYIMTKTYAYFANPTHEPHFPGAAFLLAAAFAALSLLLVIRAMRKKDIAHSKSS
ncbi:MAG: TCR/Tet family MFS transporter [Bacteroidota bacterium]|nr:TCR/Tet family MFS transporter [Bacteroidota bacterium]MDX5431779.1 TCR/Tet family MFS transporter [Bacteroidota bacterium]MDX5470492.1 TCR/Tet family MFS transporter [Bacteroidota bacterium]